jgi:DNA-binding transcriptional MocR family regulator
MTADVKGRPKYLRAADLVREQIADGTLRPGQSAPSGAALSRLTGYSTLTCRRALRALVADGVLIPGPSRSARPRVAGVPQPPGQRDLAAAGRVLAATLAARRRANGLTQPELAARVGVSVTTVGHAETGRLWQSRRFWERADMVLGAGDALLRLHDGYRAAGAAAQQVPPQQALPQQAQRPRTEYQPAAGSAREPAAPAMPARVTIVWSDGSVTTVHPPQTARGETARGETARGGAAGGETARSECAPGDRG